MKSTLCAIVLFHSALTGFADVRIFVPMVLGNNASLLPFQIRQTGIPSMRYQQVYDASAFSAISPAGGYITDIFFPADENSQGALGGSTNCQVNLSTTAKQPNNLSLLFAENVGSDDTIVFGPAYIYNGSPSEFRISLPTPFWYNPLKGNLLLDVRIYNPGAPLPGNYFLDAEQTTNDAVSCVYAESVNSTSASRVDTFGLVTIFQFSPIPTLQIQRTTNTIVIAWPIDPDVFVLQTTSNLGQTTSWQEATNRTEIIGSCQTVTLPLDSLGKTKFYRLIWESGRPVRPVATPEMRGETGGPLQTQ